MIVGAVTVAALCQDRRILRASLYGYIIAGLWVSVLLISGFYDSLREVSAKDFHEASKVQLVIHEENPIVANLNKMAFQAAEGAVIALALALTSVSPRRRSIFLGIALLCFLGSFMPMSRGGIVLAGIASCVLLLVYRGSKLKVLVLALVLGTCVVMIAPPVVFQRLTTTLSSDSIDEMLVDDGRMRVWKSALEHLPEYITIGVGYGNFRARWSVANGVHLAHNSFVQIAIYWGLAGLLALAAMVWQAYKCLPESPLH